MGFHAQPHGHHNRKTWRQQGRFAESPWLTPQENWTRNGRKKISDLGVVHTDIRCLRRKNPDCRRRQTAALIWPNGSAISKQRAKKAERYRPEAQLARNSHRKPDPKQIADLP